MFTQPSAIISLSNITDAEDLKSLRQPALIRISFLKVIGDCDSIQEKFNVSMVPSS
mgnify:CR=1 FL=1